MPKIPLYPPATTLQSTDEFVIARPGVGDFSLSGAALQGSVINPIASGDVLANLTSGPSPPTGATLSATIDYTLGATPGEILYRGSSAWQQATLSSVIDAALGGTQGDVLYRSASAWTVLAPGTAGQVLATGGPSANPSWVGQTSLSIPSLDILANATAGAASASGNSITTVLDFTTGVSGTPASQGSLLYRGASAWSLLAHGAAGQVLQSGGASANPSWATPAASLQNFLPNTQWQAMTAVSLITKMNEAGTGPQTAVSFSSTSNNVQAPHLTTTNTQAVKVGDIGTVSWNWSYAGVSGTPPATCNRVLAVVPGSYVEIVGYLGGLSPLTGTVSGTFTPQTQGDLGGGSGQGPDGWTKDGGITFWPDDFASNSFPGALRVLGMRPTSGVNFYWQCPANQLARFRGRTITVGFNVYQKTQGGSGTWFVFGIDGTQTVTSANGTGASLGGYQFLSATINVAANATTLTLGFQMAGTATDVYYVALPTAVFGPTLTQAQCAQNTVETIRLERHCNPPLLTPYAATLPTVGSGYAGWGGNDMEAMSQGQLHSSIIALYLKVEWTTSSVGAQIQLGSSFDARICFGPETVTQVSGTANIAQGWMYLDSDGTFAFLGAPSALVVTNATFDIMLAMGNSQTGNPQ